MTDSPLLSIERCAPPGEEPSSISIGGCAASKEEQQQQRQASRGRPELLTVTPLGQQQRAPYEGGMPSAAATIHRVSELRSISTGHVSCVVRRIFFPVLDKRLSRALLTSSSADHHQALGSTTDDASPPVVAGVPAAALDWFEGLVVAAILVYFACVNVANNRSDTTKATPGIEVIIACFSLFFLGELTLRLIAMGPRYLFGFASFRIADCGLILAGVVASLLLAISGGRPDGDDLRGGAGAWLRAISLLRVVRVFKLLQRISELPSIAVVISALKSLMGRTADATILLSLFLVVFSAAALGPLNARMSQRCVNNFAAATAEFENSTTLRESGWLMMRNNASSSSSVVELLKVALPALGLCQGANATVTDPLSLVEVDCRLALAEMKGIEAFVCGGFFDSEVFPALVKAQNNGTAAGVGGNTSSSAALAQLLSIFHVGEGSDDAGSVMISVSSMGCNAEQACSTDLGLGFQCPFGYQCTGRITDGPYRGHVNFNNMLWSLLDMFTCVSLQLWYEIGYYARATIGPAGPLFMSLFTLIVSYFVLNVIIIILCIEFEKERRRQQHRLALEAAAGLRSSHSSSISSLFQAAKGTGRRFQKLVGLLVKQKAQEEAEEALEATTRGGGNHQRPLFRSEEDESAPPGDRSGRDDEENEGGDTIEGCSVRRHTRRPLPSSSSAHTSQDKKQSGPCALNSSSSSSFSAIFEHSIGQRCRFWLGTAVFRVIISCCIVSSTLSLCFAHHQMSAAYERALLVCTYVFTATFLMEAAIRVCGAENLLAFLSTPTEFFDLAVIGTCVLSCIAPGLNIQWIRCLRLPRVVYFLQTSFPKVLFWFEFSKNAVMRSPLIVFCLWMLVLVFGAFCNQIYGGAFCHKDDSVSADNTNPDCNGRPRNNFDTFISSQITSFQILTADNWNEVMYTAMRSSPSSIAFHAILFCVYYFLATVIGLSLYSASMLSAEDSNGGIDGEDEEEDDGVAARLIALAKDAAAKSAAAVVTEVSPAGSGVVLEPKAAPEQRDDATASPRFDEEKEENEPLGDSPEKKVATAAVGGASPLHVATHVAFWSSVERVREVLRHIVELFWYRMFSTLVVVLQSLSLALVDPIRPPDDSRTSTLLIINIVSTFFSMFETMVRIVAYGFIRGPDSFLRRSRWHVFDFFMLLLSILGIVLTYAHGSGREAFAVRSALSLRPLLVVKLVPQVELVLISIARAVADLRYLLATIFVFYLMAAIAGVHLFSGTLYSCQPSSADASLSVIRLLAQLNETQCSSAAEGGHWTTSQPNFDSFFEGIFAVFFISIMDGWADFMFQLTDYSGPGRPPVVNANQTASIYMIIVVLFTGLVIPNLLSASLVRSYTKTKRHASHKKSAFDVSEKNAWMMTCRRLLRALPVAARDRAINGPADDDGGGEGGAGDGRGGLAAVVSGHVGRAVGTAVSFVGLEHETEKAVRSWTSFVHGDGFRLSCFALSILSFFCSALQFFPETLALVSFLRATDIIFAAAFVLECVLKVWCEGLRAYMAQQWNRTELAITIASATLVGLEHSQRLSVCFSRSVRCFRVLRISRLARAVSPQLQVLLSTISEAIGQIMPVLTICFIFYAAYATAAVTLFGRLAYSGGYDPNTINSSVNFSGFWSAFGMLFRLSTGGRWHDILLEASVDTSPSCQDLETENARLGLCGPSLWITRAFFVTWMIVSYYILNNIIIATLLDAFLCSANERALNKEDAALVLAAWQHADPNLSMAISPFDVVGVLRKMPRRTAMACISGGSGTSRVSLEIRFLSSLGIVDPTAPSSRIPFRAFFDLLCTNGYDVAPPRERVLRYDFEAKYAAFAAKLLHKAKKQEARDIATRDDAETTKKSTVSGLEAAVSTVHAKAALAATTGASVLKSLFKLTTSGAGMLLGSLLPDEILNEVEKTQSSATAFFAGKTCTPEEAAAAAAAMEEAMNTFRCSAAIIVINEFVKRWRARRRPAVSSSSPSSPIRGGAASIKTVTRLPFSVSLRPLLDCLSDHDEEDDDEDDDDDHDDRRVRRRCVGSGDYSDAEMAPILLNPL
jgi:hypothetical protein